MTPIIEKRGASYVVILRNGVEIKCHNLATARMYKRKALVEDRVSKP